MSRTFVPARWSADAADSRELGLCVRRLCVDGVEVALDGAELEGWNDAERDNGVFTHRWTRGAGLLQGGARFVIVELAGRGRFWREPRAASWPRLVG